MLSDIHPKHLLGQLHRIYVCPTWVIYTGLDGLIECIPVGSWGIPIFGIHLWCQNLSHEVVVLAEVGEVLGTSIVLLSQV